MNKLELIFECGCIAIYWAEGNRVVGGLLCCAEHESTQQKLENIVPLVLAEAHLLDETRN